MTNFPILSKIKSAMNRTASNARELPITSQPTATANTLSIPSFYLNLPTAAENFNPTPAPSSNETYSELITKLEPQRINLTEYGFEQAGLAGGNQDSFVGHLELIKNGHLLDASHSDNTKKDFILGLHNQIETENTTVEQLKLEIKQLEKGDLVLVKKHKQDIEKEIDDLNTQKAYDEEASEYSPFLVTQWIVFLSVFFVGGMAMYACMLNIILFGAIDISTLDANSVMSSMSLFSRIQFSNATSIIVPFLAALMLLFGASYLEQKNKWWLFGLAFLDFVIAIAIENQVAEIKEAMGVDLKPWTLVVEGIIIVALSFFGYFGFSQSLVALKTELDKKNPFKAIRAKIEILKRRIQEAEQLILGIEAKMMELEQRIKAVEAQIKKIENEIAYLRSNVEDVLKSLDSFQVGWFNYLTARKMPENFITKTRQLYQDFIMNN